jgi:hypothetical protein
MVRPREEWVQRQSRGEGGETKHEERGELHGGKAMGTLVE